MSNFPFSFSVLNHFWRTFCHFHPIENCHLQILPFWKHLKSVILEQVKRRILHTGKNKGFDWEGIKALAENNLKACEIMIFFYVIVENIWAK